MEDQVWEVHLGWNERVIETSGGRGCRREFNERVHRTLQDIRLPPIPFNMRTGTNPVHERGGESFHSHPITPLCSPPLDGPYASEHDEEEKFKEAGVCLNRAGAEILVILVVCADDMICTFRPPCWAPSKTCNKTVPTPICRKVLRLEPVQKKI
jgi:hypothetical protein